VFYMNVFHLGKKGLDVILSKYYEY